MNIHPVNLAVRFILEIILLIIFAYWGWSKYTDGGKYLYGIGLPIAVAVLWGVFRVDSDPGKAPVAIPGWLRLLFEMALFASAAYLFIIVSTIHYLVSYDRILWLFRQ